MRVIFFLLLLATPCFAEDTKWLACCDQQGNLFTARWTEQGQMAFGRVSPDGRNFFRRIFCAIIKQEQEPDFGTCIINLQDGFQRYKGTIYD